MKKFLQKSTKLMGLGVLGLLMASGASAETVTDVFADVESEHVNADAIVYVYQTGIVDGYPDGTYLPDKTINRAEFTKIFVNANYAEDEIADCKAFRLPFTDITEADWFAPFVCVAFEKGIIKGYDDGSFRPGDSINFVESAKILAIGETGESQSTPWFKDYVDALAQKNMIPTSIIDFDQNISRGEMAEMIMRMTAEIDTKESSDFDRIGNGGVVATSTPTSTPEETATPTPSELPTASPSVTSEPTAEVTPESTSLATATPTPVATAEITPEATAEATPTPASTPSPEPTTIATPTAVPAPTAEPTNATPAVYLDYTQEAFAQAESSGTPFAIFVHADWCPTCVALDSQIQENLSDLPNDAIILIVNYDTMSENMKTEYEVKDKHTGIFFSDLGDYQSTNLNFSFSELKTHLQS